MIITQGGETPLRKTVAWNMSKECMELLLAHGADVNIKNNVSNRGSNDII